MNSELLKIIEHYGVLPQLKYLQSEVFELNEAVIRHENLPAGIMQFTRNEYKEHIAEEIADVLVMVGQIKEYYGINNAELKAIMTSKIKRQLERIDNE